MVVTVCIYDFKMEAQRYKKENNCNKLKLLKGEKLSDSDFFCDLSNFYDVIPLCQ